MTKWRHTTHLAGLWLALAALVTCGDTDLAAAQSTEPRPGDTAPTTRAPVTTSSSQPDRALAELADRDLVLVDTAGRSQNDTVRLGQLKRFLDTAGVDEIHLVLSMTGGEKTLLQAAERFCTLGVDRILFTKLDECAGFGVILNVLRRVNRKLSYLTTGQEVPEHIQVGRANDVANLILSSRKAASA